MSTPSTLPSQKPSAPSAPASASTNKPLYVLDAFAMFALLQNEKGATTVANLIERAQNDEIRLRLSLINWGEVLYTIEREQGQERFMQWKSKVASLPILLAQVSQARIERAAHIKSHRSVSYADSFATALAKELDAIVVTGDKEFKSVEKLISVLWLER